MAAELRVFILPECIINPAPKPAMPKPEFAGLATLLVPKIVETAIGGAAKLLRDAGADKTIQSSGTAFTDFFAADDNQSLRVNDEMGCVLAVHGDFDSDDAEADDGDEVLQSLRQRGLISSRTLVNLVFEAEVRPSSDRTAFFLDTRHFSIRNLIEDDDDDERDFAVTVALSTPLASVSGETVAMGTIDFGTLATPSDLVPKGRAADGHPQFRSNLMPWAQMSTVAKQAYDADVSNGSAAGRRYMPVTFTVTISQTEKGHPFLVTLGEMLDGAKQNAATAVGKLVLPEERAKAENERINAAENLYDAELQAELEVREAQKNYDAGQPGDKSTLRAQLEIAMRKRDRAMLLRRTAGLRDRGVVPPQ